MQEGFIKCEYLVEKLNYSTECETLTIANKEGTTSYSYLLQVLYIKK